ncbi:MAG TPA: Ig-like domain-containing protein, partial [Gemmatimonadaceae bacterium]|nr:Ig-like domain-containing protein [Gemmatimonadaceae bacterium]
MRRGLIAPALLAGAIACASASPPPGGPEDLAPPRLLAVTPDSNAVNFRERNVTFQFDETINDRGSGAQELDNYFLVSPSDGNPRVSWHRSRIDVRPRNGFRENTAYSVTLLPGVADLRGNVLRVGAKVVFSTGPTIPAGRITGTVFDWVGERPAPRALVQAITPDSVRYLAQSDSAGRFAVGPLPPGSYLVRAIIDANNNRGLDRSEAFDTARVTVPQAGALELRTVQRDTLPPRIVSVTPSDSLSLRVTFDRYLDPDQPPPATAFRLVAADSTVIPVLAMLTPRAEQAETQARQQAVADSVRRVDSLAGKPLAPRPVPAA